jgi:hypothetical protein
VEYKTAFAFVQGRSHIEKNIPCQDRVQSVTCNGITVLSLADGAGSAQYSDIGAEISIATINENFSVLFDEIDDMDDMSIKEMLSQIIHESLEEEVTEKIVLKDLSSTLLFVAVNDSKYIAGHIGDGIIGYMSSKGERMTINVLSFPEKGEYHNSTFFTTSPNVQEHLRIYRGSMEKIEGFILMSDGSDESLFNRHEEKFAPAVGRFFEWMNEYPPEAVSKALYRNIEEKICFKTTDDCSVGVIIKQA